MARERSAEAPGFVPEKQKKYVPALTAATAVQKLLAALRYLWGLRSAMAESSRGKLVLFLFFSFFFEKLHQRHEDAHTHTCPAAPPESVQVRVRASASQRFACFVFMYTYTVYI